MKVDAILEDLFFDNIQKESTKNLENFLESVLLRLYMSRYKITDWWSVLSLVVFSILKHE